MLVKITALILLLFVSVFISNAQLIEKKEFRLKESKPKIFTLSKPTVTISKNSIALKTAQKDLLIAGVLSFIVPGAALVQFYKEEFVNGGIRLGISVVCVVWFFLAPPIEAHGGSAQKLIPLGIFVVNWIASIIDASYEKTPPLKRKPWRRN